MIQKTYSKKTNVLVGIFVAALICVGVIIEFLSGSINAWGPERTTYTWDKPANHPTFNSMTDNPQIGDERYFVRIREYGTTDFVDEVTLKPGKEYEVRTWYHNNASATFNDTAHNRSGFAQNVRLHVYMPEMVKANERLAIKSVISSTNTTPAEVWDETYVTASRTVALRYIPGTAKLTTEGPANNTVMPTTMFGDTGAFIGYYDTSGDLRGLVPGCEQFVGHITYRFTVDYADFTIEKTVNGGKVSDAKMGDELTFSVKYTNTGSVTQNNVSIGDSLPTGLTYIPDSTIITNSKYPEGTKLEDGHLFKEGINIGNYAAGTVATVTYRAIVDTNLDVCRNYTLINKVAILTENGGREDSASVKLSADSSDPSCDTPTPPEPPDTDRPPELPKTGPMEAAMAIIAILAITVGLTYWYRSHKSLKHAAHVHTANEAKHTAEAIEAKHIAEQQHQEHIEKRHKHLPKRKRLIHRAKPENSK